MMAAYSEPDYSQKIFVPPEQHEHKEVYYPHGLEVPQPSVGHEQKYGDTVLQPSEAPVQNRWRWWIICGSMTLVILVIVGAVVGGVVGSRSRGESATASASTATRDPQLSRQAAPLSAAQGRAG